MACSRRSWCPAGTRGASFADYLIALGFVALVVIGGLKLFGGSVTGLVSKEADRVTRLEGWEGRASGAEGGPGARSRPREDGSSLLQARKGICADGRCRAPGFCFVAGTPVLTDRGLKPIEDVEVGDRVLGGDGATGARVFRPVTGHWITPDRDVLTVTLRSDRGEDALGVTPEHPFRVKDLGWVAAGRLRVGALVETSDGGEAEVVDVTEPIGTARVHNLEVDELHTYFVGVTGAFVHNDCRDAKQAREILDAEQATQGYGPSERAVRAADLTAELLDGGKKEEAVRVLRDEATRLRAAAKSGPPGLGTLADNFEARADAYEATSPKAAIETASRLYQAGARATDDAAALAKAGDAAAAERVRAIGADSRTQAQILYQSAINSDVLLGEGMIETYRAIVHASFDKQIADAWRETTKQRLREDRNAIDAVFDEAVRIMRERGVPFHEAWSSMFDDRRMWWGDKNPKPKNWPGGAFGSRGGGFVNRNDGATWLRDHPTARGLLTPFSDISRGLSDGNQELIEKGRADIVRVLRANDQWEIAKVVLDNLQKQAKSRAGKAEADRLSESESREWWAAKTEQFVGEELPILMLTGVLSGGTGWAARGGVAALGWGTRAARATQIVVELGVFVPTDKVLSQVILDKQADWSPKALARDYAFTIGGYVVFRALGRGWRYFRERGGDKLVPAGETPGTFVPPEGFPCTPKVGTTSAEELAAARKWADDLAKSAPKGDPAELAAEAAKFEQRQADLAKAYERVMSGKGEPPPGITRERLKLAVEGDATGRKIPLNFKDAAQFERFQKELLDILRSEGVTDATVQQVGSATKGWKGNPKKPGPFTPDGALNPDAYWSPKSDLDFAVFSDQALAQARAVKAPVNTNVVVNGEYTVVKNGGGFGKTTLGQKLEDFARRWNTEFYGEAARAPGFEGIDFKLNLTNEPFQNAPTIVHGVRK